MEVFNLINIINDKNKIEVENINELYKWIKNENSTTLNNTKVEGNKEAEDLFAFFKFYFKILEECKESITDINNNFIDNTDNKLVVDATKELIRMNKDGKFIRAALIALGYYSKNLNNDNKEYLPLATAYETEVKLLYLSHIQMNLKKVITTLKIFIKEKLISQIHLEYALEI